jgi:hypothetical protein
MIFCSDAGSLDNRSEYVVAPRRLQKARAWVWFIIVVGERLVLQRLLEQQISVNFDGK